MTPVQSTDVRSHVLAWLAQPLSEAAIDPASVTDELDLLDAGLIDSFGILELIAEVEAHFAVEIDFDRLDPEGLTVLGTFASFVATEVQAARGG